MLDRGDRGEWGGGRKGRNVGDQRNPKVQGHEENCPGLKGGSEKKGEKAKVTIGIGGKKGLKKEIVDGTRRWGFVKL